MARAALSALSAQGPARTRTGPGGGVFLWASERDRAIAAAAARMARTEAATAPGLPRR